MSNEEQTSRKEKTIFEIKKNTLRKNTNCYCYQKNTNTIKKYRNDVKRFPKSMYKTHLPDQHRSYPYIVIKSLKIRNLFLRCQIGKDKKTERKKFQKKCPHK